MTTPTVERTIAVSGAVWLAVTAYGLFRVYSSSPPAGQDPLPDLGPALWLAAGFWIAAGIGFGTALVYHRLRPRWRAVGFAPSAFQAVVALAGWLNG
jgi:hypothetical protein